MGLYANDNDDVRGMNMTVAQLREAYYAAAYQAYEAYQAAAYQGGERPSRRRFNEARQNIQRQLDHLGPHIEKIKEFKSDVQKFLNVPPN